MTDTNFTKPSVSMLYDGGCPLCSMEVAHYQRMDRANRVYWSDIHADPSLLKQYGISYQGRDETLARDR